MYQDASFSEPSAPAPKRTGNSFLHFFIKQLHELDMNAEREYISFGRPIDLIRIAGVLTNIERTSASTHYQVADNTGEIRSIHYKDGRNVDNDPDIKLGSPVKVCGKMRTGNDGTREIAGLGIEQINGYHVMLYHRLASFRDAALLEQLSKGMSLAVAMGNPGRELAASLAGQQDLDGFNSSSMSTMGGFNFDKPLKNKLMMMIGACNDPLGITRQALEKTLPHINHKELSDTLQFLADEGHVYTTVTDNHYQMTGR